MKRDFNRDDAKRILRKGGSILNLIRDNMDLTKFLDHVVLLLQLLKDYITGRYRDVPVGTICAIITALLYLLSPMDAIPDPLPGGYADDGFVLAACIRMVKYDLDKYQAFRDSSGLQVA